MSVTRLKWMSKTPRRSCSELIHHSNQLFETGAFPPFLLTLNAK